MGCFIDLIIIFYNLYTKEKQTKRFSLKIPRKEKVFPPPSGILATDTQWLVRDAVILGNPTYFQFLIVKVTGYPTATSIGAGFNTDELQKK